MTFKLSQRSLNNLKGVDEDLVAVVKRAIEITEIDFGVTEGIRTLVRQEELFKKGLSKTMKSKHLIGRAVDLVAYVDGKVSWEKEDYYPIALAMERAAIELNVKIKWGGDFKSFFDGPHFELI
jgi:peptidoglycan L-alanyl-D-glutamate endopeptidase CwlK